MQNKQLEDKFHDFGFHNYLRYGMAIYDIEMIYIYITYAFRVVLYV